MNSVPTNAFAQDLTGQIEAAVSQALAQCGRSAAWRSYVGRYQTELLAALQQITGCEEVGLAPSGTAALERVLAACRLKPGDEVLLSGYDYPGTFAAIERTGARPALVDVADRSWNLCWQSLEATVSPACRVLIASHLHGQLQPIAELERWCAARQIWLIQDACQALGASIDGRPIGQFGDATIFSFGGGKTISAGRGGAWVARNRQLAQRARLAGGVGSGAYEMSELQAAVVLAQLPFLGQITQRCRAYFTDVHARLTAAIPELVAPWYATVEQAAFYQAGWVLPPKSLSGEGLALEGSAREASEHERSLLLGRAELETAEESAARIAAHGLGAGSSTTKPPPMTSPVQMGSLLIGLSQSQHAEWQRIGIGSGFQGYHRRSSRRCRMYAPLQNTAHVARATVTVHHRAALLDAPVAEALAQVVLGSSSRLT